MKSLRLFDGLGEHIDIWNSHGDKLTALPEGFHAVAHTENSPFAAIEDTEAPALSGCNFIPKSRTRRAARRSSRISSSTSAAARWTGRWARSSTKPARASAQQVGDEKVILGLSGGVDSSVAAALLHKAIGDQLTCIFVNNGLLRENEAEVVQRVFGENFHIKLKYVDASERFLQALKGVTDPETKRKIIGNEFIRVFEDATSELARAGSRKSEHPTIRNISSSPRARFTPT